MRPNISISPAEDHIEILSHIEIQMADPRSKIPQDSWGGILDHRSWIRHIESQYVLNISIWPSLNPRFLPGVPCNLGSAILKFNMFQYFNVVLRPSWFCCLHGSCYCPHVHICGIQKNTKKLMDTLPHEPEKIDFGFVWDSRALKQTKMSCFETVQHFG